MNNIKLVCFMIGLSAILFISCKEKSGNADVDQTGTSTVTATEELSQNIEPTVSLNNGVQWEVDDQVTNAVKEMQKIVSDLPASEKGWTELRDKFGKQFTEVFTNPDLTGEARTQLENYMTPVKVRLGELDSPDAATREKAAQMIRTHLDSFNNYFS